MNRVKAARARERDGYWYLIGRVPKAYLGLVARKSIKHSTGIAVADDPLGVRARKEVAALDAALASVGGWRG